MSSLTVFQWLVRTHVFSLATSFSNCRSLGSLPENWFSPPCRPNLAKQLWQIKNSTLQYPVSLFIGCWDTKGQWAIQRSYSWATLDNNRVCWNKNWMIQLARHAWQICTLDKFAWQILSVHCQEGSCPKMAKPVGHLKSRGQSSGRRGC